MSDTWALLMAKHVYTGLVGLGFRRSHSGFATGGSWQGLRRAVGRAVTRWQCHTSLSPPLRGELGLTSTSQGCQGTLPGIPWSESHLLCASWKQGLLLVRNSRADTNSLTPTHNSPQVSPTSISWGGRGWEREFLCACACVQTP